MRQVHRVKRQPQAKVLKLPVDRKVNGRSLLTAEGILLESIWDGRDPLPGSAEWPDGFRMHERTIGHPVVTR
jgi:hypothetical protein